MVGESFFVGGWRQAAPGDLPAIKRIADLVHPAHIEAVDVFAERLRLHPAGCLLLQQPDGVGGYAVSHPWVRLRPPKLDRCLGGLPARADSYLIHDLALLPACRGGGHGQSAVLLLQRAAAAAGLAEMSLMSLPDSCRFWTIMGFRAVPLPAELTGGLAGYGPGAAYMEKQLGTG